LATPTEASESIPILTAMISTVWYFLSLSNWYHRQFKYDWNNKVIVRNNFSAEEHVNRKLKISFAPRCQWRCASVVALR